MPRNDSEGSWAGRVLHGTLAWSFSSTARRQPRCHARYGDLAFDRVLRLPGRISQILDMNPCRAEPCPLYSPRTAYIGALEVAKGTFRRLGVQEGDRIEVSSEG